MKNTNCHSLKHATRWLPTPAAMNFNVSNEGSGYAIEFTSQGNSDRKVGFVKVEKEGWDD